MLAASRADRLRHGCWRRRRCCWPVLLVRLRRFRPRKCTLDRNADGIVVLTGAASRIPDAIELLAAERGKRLLITGVHRDTSAREIARLTPLYAQVFRLLRRSRPLRAQHLRQRASRPSAGRASTISIR